MAGPDKANVLLHLAREIVHLESEVARRRDELKRAESALHERRELFDRLARQEAELQDVNLAGSPFVLKPLARASSLPDRVQSLLDSAGASLTAHQIAAHLGEGLPSVRAALSKLVERGSTARVASGVYRSVAAGHSAAAAGDADD